MARVNASMFRHPLDLWPVLAVTGVFAGDLAVYFSAQEQWVAVVWWMASFWMKAQICAWNHHHQHGAFFRHAGLNRLLDLVFGFQTGVTPFGWVLHHNLGHHESYLDQSIDQARWKSRSGRAYGPFAYAFVTLATRYWRSYVVGRSFPKVRRKFVVYGALQFALLALAVVYRPWDALFVFVLPMVSGLWITSYKNHDQHAGLDTQDEYAASRNILSPSFNFFMGNLGYHTAHHFRPELHWSKLPDLHAELADRIPKECYSRPGFPYEQMDSVWNEIRSPARKSKEAVS